MENHLLSTDTTTLKELFQEQLYFIKSEFHTETKPLFHLVGENSKNIVFIVFSNDISLAEVDKDLLTKTLAGLKLSNSEIAFCINDFTLATNFEIIGTELQHQRIVCFANSTVYNSETMLKVANQGSTTILPCPALSELIADQALKVKWWNALKAFIN